MMKNKIWLLQVLIILSCTNRNDDNIVGMQLIDYQSDGLKPYSQISVKANDNFMPEYDSLLLCYQIIIDKPSWSDSNHDSIRIHRHRHLTNDSNYWDYAFLYGWKSGNDDWSTIGELFLLDESSDRRYYSLMIDLLDEIYPALESSIYFIDEEDWRDNKDSYLNYKGPDYYVRGELRLR